MSNVSEVFTAKEVEVRVGMSNQHIRRLITEGKVELVEGVEYRRTEQGTYLFNDTAMQKFIDYSSISHRGGRKKVEMETEE